MSGAVRILVPLMLSLETREEQGLKEPTTGTAFPFSLGKQSHTITPFSFISFFRRRNASKRSSFILRSSRHKPVHGTDIMRDPISHTNGFMCWFRCSSDDYIQSEKGQKSFLLSIDFEGLYLAVFRLCFLFSSWHFLSSFLFFGEEAWPSLLPLALLR